MMSLTQLLTNLAAEPTMLVETTVSNITLDSRKVEKNGLFLSLAVNIEQRQTYLQQALTQGAVVVLFDSEQPLSTEELALCQQAGSAYYAVDDLANNAAEIAARFYRYPADKQTIIAVTGTNGKTSVSQFIAQALESLGIACGVVGTLGVGRITDLKTTGMTTPDPVTLQAELAALEHQGVHYVVLEASSHALEQGRLNSVSIDIAVYTNLTRDHLDYHQTMANYAAAKQKLFKFESLSTAIINIADEFGQTLAQQFSSDEATLLTYSSHVENSLASEQHLQASEVTTVPAGIAFKLEQASQSVEIKSSLLGRFNVDNLQAALLVLQACDIDFEAAIEAITHCQAVEGRMQAYGSDNTTAVVIDFAHTPDALTQALTSLKTHLTSNGQLWCVFGCGGDRDKGKRALMGKAAQDSAEMLVLTSDNPRSENNEDIVSDIISGITRTEGVHVEHDRQQAISFAVQHAASSDIVLVAGKGHEQYQEIAGVKHAFSDAQAVMTALNAANDASHRSSEVVL
ncbi:UDP-N-acetylmuramoyl-L-alanyl-D-glutamate--2,6-diaminopimelate ligase [Methylophaga sp. 41_12_T18]|nr:UDP-N-acetylmuramoyl-L-alanyl-D-glutamate--2,6-diaminopimelate ligase [Methylophaga sp. 41_12_T18]